MSNSSIAGDPIEMAALEGVEWSWDGPTSTASPGTWTSKLQPQLAAVRAKLQQLRHQQVLLVC